MSVLLIVQLSAPASVESVAEDLPKALRKALGASGLPVDDENEDEEEAEDGEQPHHIDVLVVRPARHGIFEGRDPWLQPRPHNSMIQVR